MKGLGHLSIYIYCTLISLLLSCEIEEQHPDDPALPIEEVDEDEEDNMDTDYAIHDFSPKRIQAGDTLRIKGFFNPDSPDVSVSFHKTYDKDTINVEVLSFSQDEVVALVHNYLPNTDNILLEVTQGNSTYVSDEAIYLKPRISPYFIWEPRSPRVGELVEIRGPLGDYTDPNTVKVRFFESDTWLDAAHTYTSALQSDIKGVLVRVPPDAKSGPMEMYSEDHATGPIQNRIEIQPRNPLPKKGEWARMADMGWGDLNWTSGGAAFLVGTKAYVVGGHSRSGFGGEGFGRTTLWEYDSEYDSWFQKAPFPGGNITYGVAFSINGIGYVGTGMDGDREGTTRFYAYDPETDSWERKADFPGEKRAYAVGFVIAGNGYIGSGENNGKRFDDFYRYSPETNSWTPIPSMPMARSEAYAFVISGKAYVGGGQNVNRLDDLHMYDPAKDAWSPKSSQNSSFTSGQSSISIGNHAYVGLGYDHRYYLPYVSTKTLMRYSADADRWETFSTYEGSHRSQAVSFVIDGVGYFGLGTVSGMGSGYFDLWAYRF